MGVAPTASQKSLGRLKRDISKYAEIGDRVLIESATDFTIHPREEWPGLVLQAAHALHNATPSSKANVLRNVRNKLNDANVCTNARHHGVTDAAIMRVIQNTPGLEALFSTKTTVSQSNPGTFANIPEGMSECYFSCIAPMNTGVSLLLAGSLIVYYFQCPRIHILWLLNTAVHAQGLMWSLPCAQILSTCRAW
jgi:hypothetical protein